MMYDHHVHLQRLVLLSPVRRSSTKASTEMALPNEGNARTRLCRRVIDRLVYICTLFFSFSGLEGGNLRASAVIEAKQPVLDLMFSVTVLQFRMQCV